MSVGGIQRSAPFDPRVIEGSSRALEALISDNGSDNISHRLFTTLDGSRGNERRKESQRLSPFNGGYFTPSDVNRKKDLRFILNAAFNTRHSYGNMQSDVKVVHPVARVHQVFPGANKTVDRLSLFQSSSIPDISIASYLDRIALYSKCSEACFVVALVYIDRFIDAQEIVVSPFNVHRLFITAILLATKLYDDEYYNNSYYAKLGGIQIKELNSLEAEFAAMIDYAMHVSADVFSMYANALFPQDVFAYECMSKFDLSRCSDSTRGSAAMSEISDNNDCISGPMGSALSSHSPSVDASVVGSVFSGAHGQGYTEAAAGPCLDVDYDALMRQFMAVYCNLNTLAVHTCAGTHASTDSGALSATYSQPAPKPAIPASMMAIGASMFAHPQIDTSSLLPHNRSRATCAVDNVPVTAGRASLNHPEVSTDSSGRVSRPSSNAGSAKTRDLSRSMDYATLNDMEDGSVPEHDYIPGSIRSNHKPQPRKHKLRRCDSDNRSMSLSSDPGLVVVAIDSNNTSTIDTVDKSPIWQEHKTMPSVVTTNLDVRNRAFGAQSVVSPTHVTTKLSPIGERDKLRENSLLDKKVIVNSSAFHN